MEEYGLTGIAVFMVFPNEAGYGSTGCFCFCKYLSSKNKIVSNKVKLNVKKLPEGAPECFKNAVGNFNVDVYCPNAEKTEVKNHECCSKISEKVIYGYGTSVNCKLPRL
jgi:hypothetical protein